MAIITRLRRELSMIGILLVVRSIIITGVKTQNATTAIAIKTATAAPPNSTTSSSIVPAPAITTAATSSTVLTTSTQTTTKPTPAHSTPGTTAPSGRKFDAASFIGGIILGIVIVVLLSIGYKWYQNRRKSYHSL